MNSPDNEDAALTHLLRTASAEIPDEGFSARVMGALPPPRKAPRGARWPWFAYIGGAIGGTAFVASRVPSRSDLFASSAHLGEALAAIGVVLTEPWFMLAMILMALSLVIGLTCTRPLWRW